MKNLFIRTLLAFTLVLCGTSASWAANTTAEPVMVTLQTSAGNIELSLNREKAPKTVANFLKYAETGFYNGTIFHRVMPGFMIQGGGFDKDMEQKATRSPVINESANGLRNTRGSIAMARTNNPDSATSQFFINLVNNNYLDGSGSRPGYAVFGHVTKGMDIVDQVAGVRTIRRGPHRHVPKQAVIINKVIVNQPAR